MPSMARLVGAGSPRRAVSDLPASLDGDKVERFPNPRSADGKWLPSNLNKYQYQGERYGC